MSTRTVVAWEAWSARTPTGTLECVWVIVSKAADAEFEIQFYEHPDAISEVIAKLRAGEVDGASRIWSLVDTPFMLESAARKFMTRLISAWPKPDWDNVMKMDSSDGEPVHEMPTTGDPTLFADDDASFAARR